jgi:membrane fusion protein (multidrug efflux system)
MYATATILLEEKSDVPVLPITAVLRDGDEAYCHCVVDGRIERRPIRLGLRAGDEVEVAEGLGADDIVVLVRSDALQPGEPVEVIVPQ